MKEDPSKFWETATLSQFRRDKAERDDWEIAESMRFAVISFCFTVFSFAVGAFVTYLVLK